MPGRCPSCQQIYPDETLSFCPNDGTQLIKEPLQNAPPEIKPPTPYAPTQAYQPHGDQQAPPPNWQQPPQPPPYEQQQQPPPYNQQQPPPPYQQQQQQQYAPQYGAPRKSSKLPLIIAIIAVLLIGGGVAAYFLLWRSSDSSTSSTNTSNASTTSTANTTNTTRPTPNTNANTTASFPTPPPLTTNTDTTTTSPTPETTTTVGNYTEDEKHKLFQAAGFTKDYALMFQVMQKLGLADSKGNPTSTFQTFAKEHIEWGMKNVSWIQEYNNPQKAREYVMSHL